MSILDIPLDRVLDEIEYIPARQIRDRKWGENRYIVVHCMGVPQTPRNGGRARNNASYGQTTTRNASWQIGVDNVTAIRSAPDDHRVYGAAGLNGNGLHLEIAGNESLTPDEWLNDYGSPTIDHAAYIAAAWSLRYGIPLEYVGAQGLRDGTDGVVTHNDSSIVYQPGGHSDPGQNFPMDEFLARSRAYASDQEEIDMSAASDIMARVSAEAKQTRQHIDMSSGATRARVQAAEELLHAAAVVSRQYLADHEDAATALIVDSVRGVILDGIDLPDGVDREELSETVADAVIARLHEATAP